MGFWPIGIAHLKMPLLQGDTSKWLCRKKNGRWWVIPPKTQRQGVGTANVFDTFDAARRNFRPDKPRVGLFNRYPDACNEARLRADLTGRRYRVQYEPNNQWWTITEQVAWVTRPVTQED